MYPFFVQTITYPLYELASGRRVLRKYRQLEQRLSSNMPIRMFRFTGVDSKKPALTQAISVRHKIWRPSRLSPGRI
jgi:hypothetical protein